MIMIHIYFILTLTSNAHYSKNVHHLHNSS
jgi:hypothetical protein